MAHHSATKKSIKQIATKTARNTALRSRIRSAVKNVKVAIAENDKEASNKNLRIAQKELDRGVTKGILKKTTASRTVSRLNKTVKDLAA